MNNDIKHKPTEYVFIDVDDCLINGQTQKLLATYLRKSSLLPLWSSVQITLWFLLYRLGFAKDSLALRNKMLSFIKGWDVLETKDILRRFYDEELNNRLNEYFLDIISEHHKQRRKIFLISNAVEPLINEVVEDLELDGCIATKLETQAGTYTGKVCRLIDGDEKATVVENMLRKKPGASFGYSDHESDLPFLKKVDCGYLFRRSSSTLVRIKNEVQMNPAGPRG